MRCFSLLAMLSLSLASASCLALRGQERCIECAPGPQLRNEVRIYHDGFSWQRWKAALVSNPTHQPILVALDCGITQYEEMEIPPQITQVIRTRDEDVTCQWAWRFK